MRYLLMYYGGGAGETPAAQAKIMKQWMSWFGKLGPAMVDGGKPMSGGVMKIKMDGTVAKGAIGKRATGYSIIEAPSLDKATKLAKGCPVLKTGGEIAVYETSDMM